MPSGARAQEGSSVVEGASLCSAPDTIDQPSGTVSANVVYLPNPHRLRECSSL